MTTGPRDWVPPRIGTPRDPDCETYGGQVAEVADRLGTTLMPWQQHVMDVAYEIDPSTGRLRYDEVVLTIMRQSGKTTAVRAKKVWRCTVASHRLGPQVAMYTAQTRAAARKKLERDFIESLRAAQDRGSFLEIRNPKARPTKSTRQWKASLNNGQEHLLFGRGNYLQIDAPNREAGHGDTIDDATIDEAFAHQNDDVEQAAVPAMATRKDRQLWVVSTAGDEKSYYFWPKIRDGRRAVEAGTASNVAFFEWSLPPEADIDDEDAWWEFMPALGRTIDVEFIRRELAKARRRVDENGEDLFRRAYCNQWVRIPILGDLERTQIIDPATWRERHAPDARHVGDIALGVDVSSDGDTTALTVSGRCADGRVLDEVIHFDPGTFWLEQRLSELVQRYAPVAVAYDAGGPARVMAPEIARAAGDTPLVKLTGREWSAACEGYVLAVNENRACHLDQDWLNGAVEGAGKKLRGDGWLWDRLTAMSDIAPLAAVTASHRAIEAHVPDTSAAEPWFAFS
jgi:phage terminase large subunit-like protein